MPPEVLILTSFRQQVVAVVVARQQVVAVVVARQQVVAVRQAFAGKKLPTGLCLPLQVAIAFSFCSPPKKFYFYYILVLNRLSSFL